MRSTKKPRRSGARRAIEEVANTTCLSRQDHRLMTFRLAPPQAGDFISYQMEESQRYRVQIRQYPRAGGITWRWWVFDRRGGTHLDTGVIIGGRSRCRRAGSHLCHRASEAAEAGRGRKQTSIISEAWTQATGESHVTTVKRSDARCYCAVFPPTSALGELVSPGSRPPVIANPRTAKTNTPPHATRT